MCVVNPASSVHHAGSYIPIYMYMYMVWIQPPSSTVTHILGQHSRQVMVVHRALLSSLCTYIIYSYMYIHVCITGGVCPSILLHDYSSHWLGVIQVLSELLSYLF